MAAAKSTETEVAVLKSQTEVLNRDLLEIKTELQNNNSKLEEIKELITKNYITREEFEVYKKANNIQKWLIGIVTAIITSFVTYEVLRFVGN